MRASVNEKKKKSAPVRECRVIASVKFFFEKRTFTQRLHLLFIDIIKTCDGIWFLEFFQLIFPKYSCLWRFALNSDCLKNPIRNIWEGEAINGTCFNFLINQNRFSFLLITCSEKCLAKTKTCMDSWASLRFRNLRKVFLCCSSSGNPKILLSRVRHGLWSIRERCICWPFSPHIPLSIIEYSFPLKEKYLNFQRYNNFLIGILDVCRIPRCNLNSKINFITSLRMLFSSESMCGSSPYINPLTPRRTLVAPFTKISILF